MLPCNAVEVLACEHLGFTSRAKVGLQIFLFHHPTTKPHQPTMSSTTQSRAALSAATSDRKSRLAQLKTLKRKATDDDDDGNNNNEEGPPAKQAKSPAPGTGGDQEDSSTTVTKSYLSGRNYDVATRGPKLGFESAPTSTSAQPTLEQKAAELALETKAQAEAEKKAAKPIDVFQIRPKKPNWDLKRELEKRKERLDTRYENAIARLVRQRAEEMKAKKVGGGGGANGGASGSAAKGDATATGVGEGAEEAGTMDGPSLVGAMHVREKEEEDEERREREEEEEESRDLEETEDE
ncbi:hypothetical protein K402DRAFT_39597 [Aulographum hederae CBS 113979]|uniref:Cwf18 pre-mRNA splicing factor n=1 Tax=Aulographum hederae CBS 113979 TaxID=1176131 RepID=A0A6G1H499_9PEZI|nr:hypothetical protein K402DRAFT_39597 [Aulographum hederae CBS 113979]